MKRERWPGEARGGALATAGLCAAVVGIYAWLAFDGSERSYRLWYYTPAAALAGSFAVSRKLEGPHAKWRWALDLLVAATCLARPLTGQPPVSGHAFFALHALITCRNPAARMLAVAVAAITLYAKIVLWHRDATLWPGLAAGIASGCLWWWLGKRRPEAP